MPIESPEQVTLLTVRDWLFDISIANGFHSDCAGRVFFDRPADRDTQLPFIILDDESTEFSGNAKQTVAKMSFFVVGVISVPIDGDEKRPGRRFLWDVRKCIRTHLRNEPISGFDISFTGQSIEEPEDQSSILLPTLQCVATFPDNEIKARY